MRLNPPPDSTQSESRSQPVGIADVHSADISGYGFIDKDEFKKQIDEWIQYSATQPAPAPTALDTSLRALGKHREFLAASCRPPENGT